MNELKSHTIHSRNWTTSVRRFFFLDLFLSSFFPAQFSSAVCIYGIMNVANNLLN